MRKLLPVLLLLAPLGALADAPVRRFAVIVANDRGGEDTRPLRYAHHDARRIADTLVRLGRTHPGDLQLLLEQGASHLGEALARAEHGIAAAAARGERTELLFYYSGHAKSGDLRLGDTRFPFESLKARLAASRADVRIAMLDACRSGAITRTKGARRAPAFDVDRGPSSARGLVILTSSANDEDSQESDALTGSFFTTALVSGMVGQADASGDRRVSLAEAYAYAYERTVAGTIETASGTQHPTFHFDLAGHGDVVLTDLRGPAVSFLVLPAQLAGTWVVVDDATRTVAAELSKIPGEERRMALAPGRYLVKTRLTDRLRVGEVQVPARGDGRVDPARLHDVAFSDDPIKGTIADVLRPAPRWSVGVLGGYRTALGVPGTTSIPDVPVVGLELSLRDYLREGWTVAFDLSRGEADDAVVIEDLRFPFAYTETTGGLALIRELDLGRVRPSAGLRLAMISMTRSFPGGETEDQSLLTTAPGLQLGLSWNVTPAVSLFGRVRGSWAVLDAEAGESATLVDGAAGMRLEFR